MTINLQEYNLEKKEFTGKPKIIERERAGIPLEAMKKPQKDSLGDDDPRLLGGGKQPPHLKRGDDVNQFRDFLNNVRPEDFIDELDEDIDLNSDN